MIDLESESPISLKAAARLPAVAVDGKSPHLTTVHRWVTRGIQGVKLETVQIGGTRCTTAAAVLRFIERLTHPHEPVAKRTPAAMKRAAERISKELEKSGW